MRRVGRWARSSNGGAHVVRSRVGGGSTHHREVPQSHVRLWATSTLGPAGRVCPFPVGVVVKGGPGHAISSTGQGVGFAGMGFGSFVLTDHRNLRTGASVSVNSSGPGTLDGSGLPANRARAVNSDLEPIDQGGLRYFRGVARFVPASYGCARHLDRGHRGRPLRPGRLSSTPRRRAEVSGLLEMGIRSRLRAWTDTAGVAVAAERGAATNETSQRLRREPQSMPNVTSARESPRSARRQGPNPSLRVERSGCPLTVPLARSGVRRAGEGRSLGVVRTRGRSSA